MAQLLIGSWIAALGYLLICWPGQIISLFGVILLMSLIRDSAETRRFHPW